MATLPKLIKQRTSKRNILRKRILDKVNELVSRTTETQRIEEVSAMLSTLDAEYERIKKLDEAIFDKLEEENEMEKESDEVMEFDLITKTAKEKISKYLTKYNEDTVSTISSNSTRKGVKLPKFEMKCFEGNPMQWKTFIETFEASINCKDDISEIEKFSYLKGYLTGPALNTIEGFTMTNENYLKALTLLKERFGNTQLIIASHMNDLIKIEKASNNITKLRQMYDKIEANVRALNSEGIDSMHFGPMLIPIILEKLPNSIQLQISRRLGKSNWDVEEFIKCINEEVTAREN